MLLLRGGHCLRDHVIAACGPRRGTREPRIEATQPDDADPDGRGRLGVTLLPGITLDAGILKGTGSSRAASRRRRRRARWRSWRAAPLRGSATRTSWRSL
jgi:LysR family hydrogen peroxide-inducible transcriptional activator